MARLLPALVCGAALGACAGGQAIPRPPLGPLSAKPPESPRPPPLAPRAQLLAQAEGAFVDRTDPARLYAAIAAWAQAVALEDTAAVRLALARAEHFGGGSATGAARAPRFQAGAAHAQRALELLAVPEDQRCTCQSAAAAPALFWLAENLDASSREAGLVAGTATRREALCLARRAAQLDPAYFHAGPLRTLGRLLAQLPALEGGDVTGSRGAFERAQALAPESLANRVDAAGTLLVKVQDVAAFEQTLAQVLAAPEGPAALGPENRRARAAALDLKARLHTLFR